MQKNTYNFPQTYHVVIKEDFNVSLFQEFIYFSK